MDYKDVLKSDYFNETYAKIEELKKDFYVNHGFVHVDGVINNAKFQKLFEVFRKLERVWGYKTELRVLDWECGA